MIALTGLMLFAQRRRNSLRTERVDLSDFAPLAGDAEPRRTVAPRLIFSPFIQVPLIALIAISIVIALSHAFGIGDMPHVFDVRQSLVNLSAIAALAAFVLAAPTFRFGAKTLMDIVDHFTTSAGSFPIRARIAARFRESLLHILDQSEQPNLVIISHSQGTVVAVDALQDIELQKYIRSRVRSLTLLTFGSPYEHIYRHYFPIDYPAQLSCEFEAFAEQVKFQWTNVFRCDDYVGTFVRPSSKCWGPKNVPLKRGGHVDYWRPEVFLQLQKQGRLLRGLDLALGTDPENASAIRKDDGTPSAKTGSGLAQF
jgi:hypothetical protein